MQNAIFVEKPIFFIGFLCIWFPFLSQFPCTKTITKLPLTPITVEMRLNQK